MVLLQAFERTSCEQNLESASNENREYHSHVICSSSNSEPIIDSLMFGDNPRFEASQTSSVGQVRCSGSEPNSSGSISDFPAFNSSPAICRNASASFSAITEEHNHALQSESESESSVISQDQDQRGQSIQYSEQNAIILRELSAASTAEDTGAVIPCPGALNSIEPPRYWTLSMSASPLKLVDVSNEMLPCIQNVMDETCKREHIGQRYRGAAPKSIGRCHKGFSVVNVRYIENPELWQRYAHERKMIGERYQEGPVHHYGLTLPVILEPLCREANEVFLFHGTHGDNVDDIIRHGFDPRVGADDNLMGNGIYFAENSSKSDEYCIADTKGICRMFVARVALGEKYEAARLLPSVRRPPRSTDQPSKQYDSVVGITTEARPDAALEVYKQYVVYDGRQIYPEFLVEYKRVDADGDELEDEISSWRDAGQANANSFSGPAPAVFAAATRRVSELRGTSATKVRDDRVGELQASVKALVEDMQILKSFVLSKGEERRETTDVQTSPLPLQCAESPSASLRGLSEGSRGVAGGRRERAGRGRARSSSRPLRRTSRSLSADGRRYSDRERRNGHRRRSERDERRRDRTRGRDRSRSRVPSHPRRSERSNSRSYARSRSRDGSRWRVEKNSSSRGRRRCSREGSRHHQERSRSRVERSSSRGQGSSSRGRRSGCHEGRSSSWGRRSGCHEGRSSSRGRGGGRGRIRGGSKERRHDRRRRHGGERSRDDSR